jgi:hypothetical protein
MQMLVCLKFWVDIICFDYTHFLVKSWQLVTAVCDEDNGLTLCERLSQGYDHTHSDVTFKVLLWRFPQNLIDMRCLCICRAHKEKAFLGAAPSISNHPEKAMHRAREMFAEYMTEQAQEPFGHPLDAMPFHLRMMECILDETSNFFYQKAER